MPKEWTHWLIASAAFKAHSAESPFFAAAECPAAYYLGSVAHDSPYYCRTDSKITRISADLHGGLDSYAPVMRILKSLPDSIPAKAFACGALSHIAADTVFHPAVFYFTGSSSHPDPSVRSSYMFNHWAFETAMDRYFSARHKMPVERGFGKLLQKSFNQHWSSQLYKAAAAFYGLPAMTEQSIDNIFHAHASSQKKFNSMLWYALANIITVPVRRKNLDVRPAFYPYRKSLDAWFEAKRDYRHCVTGVEGVFDADDFFSKAVEKTTALVGNFYKADKSENPHFLQGPGNCLDTDLPGNDVRPMIFMDRKIFLP